MKILIPLLSLFLITCSEGNKSKLASNQTEEKTELPTNLPESKEHFQSFLDQLPKIDLPLRIKGCEISNEGLIEFNEDKPSPYVPNGSYAVGQISTNGNYVSIITLAPAECLLPVITTYDPKGEKIDSKTIAIGYCGVGPCFECEEFMTLKEDYSIYTADTIKTSECDDDYNPIEGTESIEVVYIEGKLRENGEIELSEKLKKKIPISPQPKAPQGP